jgi:hypothetical protein
MWQTIYREFRRWTKVSGRTAAAYRRTEITVETDRVLIIRKSHSTRAWCAECGREVDMVDLNEVGAIAGTPQGMAQRLPGESLSTDPMLPGCGERPGWHWSQAADGSTLVCLESLLKSM